MSLNDIIEEAQQAGVKGSDLETVKRQYYYGILKYEENHSSVDFLRYGSAILGLIHHRTSAEYSGEAHARQYIKQVLNRGK